MPDVTLSKLRRLSLVMKLLTVIVAYLVGFGAIYLLWQPAFDWVGFRSGLHDYLMIGSRPITPTPLAMAGLAIIGTVNIGIILFGLRSVWRLFDRFGRGDVFSPTCGSLLRRIGLSILCGAISLVLSRTVGIVLVTFANPPGQGMLAVTIGTSEALLVLVSGLLIVMGHVMTIATEVDAENRSFI